MIVVTHTEGKVVNISPEQAGSLAGKSLTEVLFILSKLTPESLLVWCENRYESLLNKEEITSLFLHDRLMMSYSVSGDYSLPEAIGYVEDSPFLKIERAVQYPTWLMSENVGVIHASTLRLFEKFELKGNAGYILSSIAKIGQRNGLICYSCPNLVKIGTDSPKTNKTKDFNSLFKFVYQHYKTRWMFMLLFNYIIFEKKFPLLAFLKGFINKKLGGVKPTIGEVSVNTNNQLSERSIDVIIPTIGRKLYLRDVLKDLSMQTCLPKKVIIVEQNPQVDSNSELDYLINTEWPFEIDHHFTHQTGACNARNIAVSKIASAWVFMADDDIRFGENVLEEVLNFLDKFKAKAVTLSCLRDGDIEHETNVVQWRSFGSGCSVVASEAVKTTSFDMGFEHGFGEDTDYGMQLRNKGYDVLYNPFITLKHLKAPIGGFRQPIQKPWEDSHVLPKPSPTIMLYRIKHTTKTQLRGYKLLLFLKFYKEQSVKNPFSYLRKMKQRWNCSLDWAHKLMEV